MKQYYQQVRYEALKVIRRFVEDTPTNPVEAAVFRMIREIGDAIGLMLQRWLDTLRGIRTVEAT